MFVIKQNYYIRVSSIDNEFIGPVVYQSAIGCKLNKKDI